MAETASVAKAFKPPGRPVTDVREERRLAAIVIGDVVGYSRMMGLDEVGTMNALKAHRRELILPLLTSYRARLVNSNGDAMLLEFGSAVDAVSCAASLQRGMQARNAQLDPDRQIRFRLGINLGDIVIDGHDIYGDGVNVAARLEQMCEPGGLCLSRSIEEQVRDKLPYPFEDRGEHELKNIARSVRVFGLTPEAIALLPEPAVIAEPRLAAATQLHVQPGTRLNDAFAIDRLIGSGGMGEIFEGHELATGDAVAIKFIRLDMEANETALSLFQKEASVLKQVHHEAVIRYSVFSFDPTVRRHYLAMEYVDGLALSDLMKRGPLPLEAVDTLRKRVAAGLQAAHDRGIVHRDISPDNIILPDGNVGRAKVIDFGIARAATLGGGTIIGGGFAGKYNYVSPEQLGLFGGDVTNRSDIYSFGLVLAGALLGQPIDMGGSQADVIDKRRTVPDLSRIDPRLRPLLEAMLQPDPAGRPGSMADVAAWSPTSAAVAREPTLVPPLPPTPLQPIPAPPLSPRAATPAPATGRPRSVRPLAIATVFLVVVLFGGGAAILRWPSSKTGNATPSPTLTVEPVAKPPATTTDQPPPGPTPEPAVVPVPTSPGETPPSLVPTAPTAPTPPPEPQSPATPGPSATVEIPPESPEPGQPTAVVPGATQRVASFLGGYDGGTCFFATALDVTDNSAGVQGFAASPDTFEAFAAAFTKSVGFEPKFTGNRLWSKQCPAARFLRQVQSGGGPEPDLFLKSTRLRSGEALSGEISGVEDQSVMLLRVREDGSVEDITRALKDKGSAKDFDVPLSLDGPGPYPQLILAVATPEPLPSPGTGQADKVLQALLKNAADRKQKIGASVRLVLLGG